MQEKIDDHARRHHRASDRAARAEPESAPQQKRHRQIDERVIVDAVNKPGIESDERARDQTGGAADGFRHLAIIPLPKRPAGPHDEERRQHEHGERIRNPPRQHIWQQCLPRNFIFTRKPGRIDCGIQRRAEAADQQKINHHVAQAFLRIFKIQKTFQQPNQTCGNEGIAYRGDDHEPTQWNASRP